MNKKSVKDLDLSGKRVLVRVDFNVPLDGERVTDDTRINAALPTLNHILGQGASLVLMSHLGRPKGKVNPEFSLKPVVPVLAERLGRPVAFVEDCVGPAAEAAAAALKPGEVLLLENLRFHAEEEGKGVEPAAQEAFAAGLAKLGDVYVNDAFGTAHRAHASMAGITAHFPGQAVAGFLLEKEIQYLGKTLEDPARPFVAIIGGKKVSDKILVIENLLSKVDALLIGGAMAYPFMKAQGKPIGDSYCQEDDVPVAADLLKKAAASGIKFMLPVDTKVADAFSADANTQVVAGSIPDGWEGLDIGPATAEAYAAEIRQSKTVVWNGPMGCFEMAPFAHGTNAVAQALADTDCVSIIGGGDSVSAIKQAGLDDRITHISTGGGASLELLEGKVLPGLAALSDA